MNIAVPRLRRGAGEGPAVTPALLAPSLERRRLRAYLAQMLIDAGALLGAFALAGLLYKGSIPGEALMKLAQLMLPIFLTIALYSSTYAIDSLRDWRGAALKAVMALAIAAALLNFIVIFARLEVQFSRFVFLLALALAAMAMAVSRRAAVGLMRRSWGPSPLNVLLIDAGGADVSLPHTYRISAAEHDLEPSLDDPQALDRFGRFVQHMDQVIVSCPMEQRQAWAMVLKGSGVHGEVLSEALQELGALGVIRRDEIDLTTVLVSTGPLGLRARAAKRALDVSVSAAALVLLAPLLAAAVLAIKLEDGGPVLFRQRRIGRRNQLFAIYKLRTMSVEGSDADGNQSTSKGDSRITRVGNFLRRTSIDELPQLFNVLRGEMSLVGPRPHAIGSLAGDKLFWEVDQRYWHRHSLRPGLTGLAQVRGFRGATDLEDDLSKRLQADLEYLDGWTIWRDIGILFATVRVLVHDRAF